MSASAIATLLQARGYKVKLRKLDPYLNVDPGTMNPNQHGEVFVTDDGAETDLDLGHYERFTGVPASRFDNITAGKVYQQVILNERKGKYLGKTVQVIPHVTDQIKLNIKEGIDNIDFLIIEVGGTVGDIESLPFLEAIRQIRNEIGNKKSLFIHLTLIPYLAAADELKTKPTQHSVKELREIGIQPDILICRSEKKISIEDKNKIALFCNINVDKIIQAIDVKSIYELPKHFQKEGLDKQILNLLSLSTLKKADLTKWEKIVFKQKNLTAKVNIGIIGKYTKLKDAYKSLTEALHHSGINKNVQVIIDWVDASEKNFNIKKLKNLDGILVPGGFGKRGIEGKIRAITYARKNFIPFFGICFGMQLAVIEVARNLLNIKNASSSEFTSKKSVNIIGLLKEWDKKGIKVKRNASSEMGGTMRLGSYLCHLTKDSLAKKIYKKAIIKERHRHRYEMNIKYENKLSKKGLVISGKSPDGKLPEIIEIKKHPWFIGVQFHPELISRPLKPHPLFNSFINASIEYKEKKNEKTK